MMAGQAESAARGADSGATTPKKQGERTFAGTFSGSVSGSVSSTEFVGSCRIVSSELNPLEAGLSVYDYLRIFVCGRGFGCISDQRILGSITCAAFGASQGSTKNFLGLS